MWKYPPVTITETMEAAQTPMFCWKFGEKSLALGGMPRLLGIVNVTPDSFSDGGEFFSDGGEFVDPERAVSHALQLVEEGADVLDVGGESTRPGSEPVPAEEELGRVIPVIERLRGQTDRPISIDTTKAAVARAALAAGADIVNDISGLTFDAGMPAVCAESGGGVICMHIRGTPKTMQEDPQYDDVVRDVRDWLAGRLNALVEQGIERERIVLDPGIGFGKTAEHNLALMRAVPELHVLGRPILIGHSRKRFLGKLLGRKVEERTAGTIGVSIALAEMGADLIRVHDVGAVRDALTAWAAVKTGIISG